MVSPDRDSVFVAAYQDDSIAQFHRKQNGGLAYRGCLTGNSTLGPSGAGACRQIPTAKKSGEGSGLSGPLSMGVAGRGTDSLYVTTFEDVAVAVFKIGH